MAPPKPDNYLKDIFFLLPDPCVNFLPFETASSVLLPPYLAVCVCSRCLVSLPSPCLSLSYKLVINYNYCILTYHIIHSSHN